MATRRNNIIILFSFCVLLLFILILKYGFDAYQYNASGKTLSYQHTPKPKTKPAIAPVVETEELETDDPAEEIVTTGGGDWPTVNLSGTNVAVTAESGSWKATAAGNKITPSKYKHSFTARTKSGTVTFQLGDKGLVKLAENTRLEIHREKGEFPKLVLLGGKVTVKVLKEGKFPKVRTNKGSLRDGESTFTVLLGKGTLRAQAQSGSVTYINKKGSFQVKEGQQLKAKSRKKTPKIKN